MAKSFATHLSVLLSSPLATESVERIGSCELIANANAKLPTDLTSVNKKCRELWIFSGNQVQICL
jgi:hypothetical protein